jgi:glycosyltransferase involved in cell wall biosynthesis
VLSVVAACWNRRALAEAALRTMGRWIDRTDVEVVLVDDGSADAERIDHLASERPRVRVVRLSRERKKHCNSCVPFNVGFHFARGEVIAIQPAECLWTADLATAALARGSVPDTWTAFGCYSVTEEDARKILAALPEATEPWTVPRTFTEPRVPRLAPQQYVRGWYTHSAYRPIPWHFFVATQRATLEAMGGFDLRYAQGWNNDDEELIARLRRRPGLRIEFQDEPFVVHMPHPCGRQQLHSNWDFYCNVTLQERGFAANGGRFLTPEYGLDLVEAVL